MFTYLNPGVRERLVTDGKLIRIDGGGRTVAHDHMADIGETIVNLLGPIPLPINKAGLSLQVDWYAAVRSTELEKVESLAETLRNSGGQNLFATLASSMAVNSVLLFGDPATMEDPLVRVHSNCLTGDVFGSQRCECGPQLNAAISQISGDDRGGMIIYMAGHEGRGIGLWAKAATYLLQDAGENTYQANETLGLPADSRDFSDAAAMILFFLGNRPFRLLTNNPKKISDLENAGLSGIRPEPLVCGVSRWNRRYLSAKKSWGHDIDHPEIDQE